MDLWPHQRRALDWLAAPEQQAGGLLHVAMGGGKTRISIEYMRQRGARRALITAPLAVLPAWQRELDRWWPDHPPVIDAWTGPIVKRAARALQVAQQGGIVLSNYDAVWRAPLGDTIARTEWDVVIWDESQRLKSPSSRSSRYAARLRRQAQAVLLLSGTPMPQGPHDVWAQLRACRPEVFPPAYTAFLARYTIAGRFGLGNIVGYRNLSDFEARLSRVTFPVDVSHLERPDSLVVDVPVQLEPGALRAYHQLASSMVASIGEGERVSVSSVLTMLLRLQQLTGGWLPSDEGNPVQVSNAKREALRELIDELPPDEPLVVFCQFRRDLATVHEVARELGTTSAELSGGINQLAEWQAPGGPRILAVQTRSGGVGISLVRAAYAVWYSLTYSYGDYEQALARLVRPGQTRPVTFYRLLARGTVDERIARTLERKGDIIEEIAAEITRRHEEVFCA
jgi:SNF2 family DNA or RNA helicase